MTESNTAKHERVTRAEEVRTAQELFDDVIARRGGFAAFSQEALRIARAYVRALAGVEVDPQLCERLSNMLPPVVARSSGPGRLDLASCPDAVVDEVDGMCARMAELCTLYGRTPVTDADAPESLLREVLDMNSKLQELVDAEQRRCRVLEDRLVVAERLTREATATADAAIRRAEVAEASAWRAHHAADEGTHGRPAQGQQTVSGERSNVVSLADMVGDSNARVNGSLAERYPSLAHDPPVSR